MKLTCKFILPCDCVTVEIPGPIDNHQLIEALDGETSQNQLTPSTNYIQLSASMWQFLHAIYGGGPAVEL